MRAVKLVVVIVGAVALVAWWLAGDRDLDAPPPLPAPSRDAAGVDPAPPPVASLPESEVAPEPLAERAPEVLVLRVTTGTRESATPRTRSAMAGVEVEAGVGRSYPANLTGPALAGGQSDAAGELVLAIPWEHVEAAQGDRHQKLWVRASARGFLPRTEFQELPASVDAAPEFELDLQRGAQLEVLLLGPDGEPAAGEAAIVRIAEGELGAPSWRRVGADGRVRLSVRVHQPVAVLARGAGARTFAEEQLTLDPPFHLGLGLSEVFEIADFEAPPETPVLVRLESSGSLRGRLVDARGVPAAGVLLRASRSTEASVAPLDARAARLLAAPGARSSGAVTGLDGTFRLGGLLPGRYELAAEMLGGWDDSGRRLTETAIPADGTWREFELSRPHLVLRLVDEQGHAFTETDAHDWFDNGGPWHAPPEAPRLLVLRDPPAYEHGRSLPAFGARPLEPGVFVVEVEAGLAYEVGVFARDRAWRPVRVELANDATRVDVLVPVPALVEPARLELTALDVAGLPLESGLRVSVRDAVSGLSLFEHVGVGGEPAWPMSLGLPPGRHRVRVAGATVQGHHFPRALPDVGAAEREVELVGAETTAVELVVPEGARLRLHLEGEPTADDARAAVARHGLDVRETSDEDRDFWNRFADVSVLSPHAPARPVNFLLTGHRPRFGRFDLSRLPGVPLGETLLSEPLPAGRHTLIVRLPGGRELRREVELFDGVTTDVTLDFR